MPEVEPTIQELEAEITTLGAHLNAGTHRFLILIGEFDRREGWGGWGIRSCAHWLNWKCGLGLGAAREQLRVASALPHLPGISDAMRSGRLSYTKVRAMTRIATPENECALLSIAENGTASHIETVVRHYRRTRRADELQRDAERYERRCFRYHWDHDGSLVIEGRLPPEQGALVIQALKAADQALREVGLGEAAPGEAALGEAALGEAALHEKVAAARVTAAPAEHSAVPAAALRRSETASTPSCRGRLKWQGDGDAADPAEPLAFDKASWLDPEQQEALEKLQVAAQQHPNQIDAAVTQRDGPPEEAAAANGIDAPNPALMPGAENVSAGTSQPALDWCRRQADALALLAETMLAGGAAALHGADRQLLHVHIDLSTLCSPNAEGRSTIEGGPAVPPETLRRLGCDAALVRWIEEGAGKTLDVGRKTRVISAGLRRALEQRDTGCRFPACEQRRFLDAHHIEHWADGGETKLQNLVSLCKRHHRVLHEGGFRIEGDADAPRFVRPDGKVIAVAPRSGRASTSGSLVEQNARLGLRIQSTTAMTGWGGERADYTHMLTLLGQYDAPGVERHSMHAGQRGERNQGSDSARAVDVSAERSA
jgi:hypothetical protein